tara:strand:- start:4461 stop:4703 length:243 start_codon:yes stop_codon:yes gene_type:complete
MQKNLYLKTAVIGLILNVVLSFALAPFATREETKPPNGPSKLSFKSQVMHMLVHHKHVIVSSSVIVALVAGLACYIACRI